MIEVGGSKNATLGAFGPPQQSEGARRVQSPEAMAIEDNPPGPTKHKKGLLIAGFFVFGGLPHSEGGEASRQTRP